MSKPILTAEDAVAALADFLCDRRVVAETECRLIVAGDTTGTGDSWAAAYEDARRNIERQQDREPDYSSTVGDSAALHLAWLAKQPRRKS